METTHFIITADLMASKAQRLLNFLVDVFIISLIDVSIITTGYIVAQMTANYVFFNWIKANDVFIYLFLWVVVALLYYAIMEIYFSRTVGKYVTKTLVITNVGSKPSLLTIIKRTLARFIPFEVFSFLNKDGRGWHDAYSQTYVVRKHKFNATSGHVPFYG